MLTKEQFEQLEKHIPTMKLIITNRAMSNISIEYRDTINRIGKQLGYNYCPSCSAGIYNLTAQLYNKYIEYKNAEASRAEAKNAVKQPDKKRPAKTKQ